MDSSAAAAGNEIAPGETAAEAWSPPPPKPVSRYFEASDGVRLHYLEWTADGIDIRGNGAKGAAEAAAHKPVIAMVHGRLAHARWFDPVGPLFADRYDCVALDLRGHGDSGSSNPIHVKRMLEDLQEWLALFEGRPIILVGHSYGGGLTALLQPMLDVRPRLYVMADTLIHWDPSQHRQRKTSGPKLYATREEIIGRFRLIPGGTAAPPEVVRYIAGYSIRQVEDGRWTWKFDEGAVAMPPDGILLKGEDIELEDIRCPSLIIYGENSEVSTVGEAQKVAGRMPDAELHCLKGGHHHITLDDPAGFHRALVDFFGRHGM